MNALDLAQSHALRLWLLKRAVRAGNLLPHEPRSRLRHTLRQQWQDYGRRGRGNRAWKRAAAIERANDAISVDPFAIARSVLRDFRS